MKKSLVLAMALAMGVAASAYAANPFSDVPAGHWAYDSIDKLAAAGVVDGYGDDTYRGDKLLTRYEMAQIIARAMAKGANVDRLAAEFADELDALGVRVAALEKKADAVKITGQIRYSYLSGHGDLSNTAQSRFRTRLWISGQVNDDWTYTGMLQNVQKLNETESGDEGTDFQRAYVDGKLGGLKIRAGRYNYTDITASNLGGNIYDTRLDGIQAAYGGPASVTFGYAKASNDEGEELYFASLQLGFGKASDFHAGYYNFKDLDRFDGDNDSLWTAGLNLQLAKDVKLDINYMNANCDDADGDDDGFVVGLKYAGASASKPGSFGVFANYLDLAGSVVIQHGMDQLYTYPDEASDVGFKGWAAGVEYTFAKNIVGQVVYTDFETKEADAQDVNTVWSSLIFTF